jgi:hypothetical protein
MADFTAPFHAPKFTTDEFEKQKEAYTEKHGYTVTIPTLGDIIHLKAFKPMTDQEKKLYSDKKYDQIPPDRLKEILDEKQRKRDKYLSMLADPSPKIARDAAAVLTALDDIQDAISTIACIAMVGAVIAGGPVAAAVAGPVGLILGASTLLNLINPMSHLRRAGTSIGAGRGAKKKVEELTDKNPFTKKGRVKIAKNIKKFRPTVGNAIEALQTTDQIFGFGISIGPIMGFVQGAISGAIRKASGEKVTLAYGTPDPTPVNKAAYKALAANAVLHGQTWESDVTDETMSIYAASLALQALYVDLEEFNPIEQIEDIGDYLIECPQPTDPLTIEILQESGVDPSNACKWPQNGQRFISLSELQATTQNTATLNLKHYAEQNNHTLEAFNALSSADDFALNFLSAIEGPENVVIDYSIIERIIITILDNGLEYPDDITPAQIEKFEDYCYVHDYMGTKPTIKDIIRYSELFCGFSWKKSPDQYR